MHSGAAARAELGFCQHAAHRAVALLELQPEGGQSHSGLAAACSNSTWMAFGDYSEQCGVGLRLGAALGAAAEDAQSRQQVPTHARHDP